LAEKQKTPLAPNKKKLLQGIFLIFLAFICMGVVVFFGLSDQLSQTDEIEYLADQIEIISEESEVAKRKAVEFEETYSQSISLDKILEEAQKQYDEGERDRKEGFLWIDRETQTLVVTLGALNGVSAGTVLTIYDGDEKVGVVRVETPLDVISYVQPINKTLKQLDNDNYRVVVE